MIIAHIKTKAVGDAPSCGTSLVGRIVLCCVLAGAGLSVAHAGPGDKERDERAAQFQRERAQQRPADQRQFDSRAFEQRAEEQRRQLQAQQDQNAQNNADARRGQRMTPDERRDLRRQINEAGVELYQKNPRR